MCAHARYGSLLGPVPGMVRAFETRVRTTRRGTVVEVHAQYGAAALERGYNALIFEGPGQGSMLFERRVPFRPDWEAVITPLVDFLRARPDVNAAKIALIGVSFGGVLTPRAVAF